MDKEQLGGNGMGFDILFDPKYYSGALKRQLRIKQNSTHVIHFALNALVKDK